MTENKSKSPLTGVVPKALSRPSPVAPAIEAGTVEPDEEGMSPEQLEDLEKRVAEIRANRELHGTKRGRLEYESRVGYVRRWFNDLISGRVEEYERRGWSRVFGPDRKVVARGVGTHEGGGKLSAVLMEIPKEIWDEDFNAKQEKQDKIDEDIYNDAYGKEKGEARHVPSVKTNFTVNNRAPTRRN